MPQVYCCGSKNILWEKVGRHHYVKHFPGRRLLANMLLKNSFNVYLLWHKLTKHLDRHFLKWLVHTVLAPQNCGPAEKKKQQLSFCVHFSFFWKAGTLTGHKNQHTFMPFSCTKLTCNYGIYLVWLILSRWTNTDLEMNKLQNQSGKKLVGVAIDFFSHYHLSLSHSANKIRLL